MKLLNELRKEYEKKSILEATDRYNQIQKSNHVNYHLFKDQKTHEKITPPKVFLYIMRNNRNGYFKIGKSKHPKIREKTLQSEDPDIAILYTYSNSGHLEKRVHKNFSDYRVRGEWFKFTDPEMIIVLEFINALIHPENGNI